MSSGRKTDPEGERIPRKPLGQSSPTRTRGRTAKGLASPPAKGQANLPFPNAPKSPCLPTPLSTDWGYVFPLALRGGLGDDIPPAVQTPELLSSSPLPAAFDAASCCQECTHVQRQVRVGN